MKLLYLVILIVFPLLCTSDDEPDNNKNLENCQNEVGAKNVSSPDHSGLCLRNCMMRKVNAIDADGTLNKEGMRKYITQLKESGVWEKSGMAALFKVDYDIFYESCNNLTLVDDP